MLNPNAELMSFFYLFQLKQNILYRIILLDLFSAVTGVAIFSSNNTAFVAHIGGALTGFIINIFGKKSI